MKQLKYHPRDELAMLAAAIDKFIDSLIYKFIIDGVSETSVDEAEKVLIEARDKLIAKSEGDKFISPLD